MPWGSAVERREEFVRLARSPGANMAELCRRFGVSRSNGYKWLARFEAEGASGLAERSRRPVSSPERTPAWLEAKVLTVRAENPAWGGRKIRRVLEDEGVADVPSASTITEILRRAEVLDGPRSGEPRAWTRFEQPEPNLLWQMDFKGHFALDGGRRCHPLTVLDDHSRYALEIGACGDEQATTVEARLIEVFRHYGLPRRILADNGPPWGTAGAASRHTTLTVWLMDLGVGIVHGRPYHPQTQGKDERFHRTLKAEVLNGRSFNSLDQAQAAFEAWRSVYNTRRPHEALAYDTPGSRYRMSPRAMPETIEPAQYEPQSQVRQVGDTGWISFKGRAIHCSKAFAGKRVVLRATDTDGLFDLCYRTDLLAQVDLRENIAQPVLDVPEQVSSMSPV
jgi:transposase InsO family protein